MRMLESPLRIAVACSIGFLTVAIPTARADSRDQMKKIVHQAEQVSNDLDDDLPDAAKRTPLKGTADQKRLARQAEALEDALDKVKEKFNRAAGFSEIRSHVDEAIRIAEDIDPLVARYQFTQDVETDWRKLRGHLNSMAEYFNVRSLDNGQFVSPPLPKAPPVWPSPAPSHGAVPDTPSRNEMISIIARTEKLTDDLLGRRRASGPTQIEALEDTMDRIKDRFANGSHSEMVELVNRALGIAEDINRDLLARSRGQEIDFSWAQVRNYLNAMARYYSLPVLPDRNF